MSKKTIGEYTQPHFNNLINIENNVSESLTNDNCFCTLTIKVKEITSSTSTYDVTYIWKYRGWWQTKDEPLLTHNKLLNTTNNNEKELLKLNPFYNYESTDDFYNNSLTGDYISKNKMTESMIEYLCMDDELLSNEDIGCTTSLYYRITIMKLLSELWI